MGKRHSDSFGIFESRHNYLSRIPLLIPLAWFFLYKTRPGLWLRSVGEDPYTADAMGIDVTKTRYFYTIIGGMLIALGGAHLSLSYTSGWSENITGGRG